jgi:hypothetical protein
MNFSILKMLTITFLALYIPGCYAQSCPRFTLNDGVFTRHLTNRGHHHQKFHSKDQWWHIVEEDALFDLEESLTDKLLPDFFIGDARPRFLDDLHYCVYPVRTNAQSSYFVIMSEDDFKRYDHNTAHYLKWLRHHHHKRGAMETRKDGPKMLKERLRMDIEYRRALEAKRRRIALEERLSRLRNREQERRHQHESRPEREAEIIFKG